MTKSTETHMFYYGIEINAKGGDCWKKRNWCQISIAIQDSSQDSNYTPLQSRITIWQWMILLNLVKSLSTQRNIASECYPLDGWRGDQRP